MTSPALIEAHTPGPWLADFHNEEIAGGRFVTYVRGGNQLVPIAAVPTGVEGYGRDEGRANALVIAAAPDAIRCAEILAALEADDGGRRFPTKEDCDFARATLAKALGQ